MININRYITAELVDSLMAVKHDTPGRVAPLLNANTDKADLTLIF